MASTIVLYGATGYSGGLLADELDRLREAEPGTFRVVLAGRDLERVRDVAAAMGMEFCVFPLDDQATVQRALQSLDAKVVVNAAGPFARSGKVLVKAAIEAGCHYTDINGEVDVYQTLLREGRDADHAGVALVGSAGFWAAASNLLLDTALNELVPPNTKRELGAVRIGMSRIQAFSRGSASTVWHSLRQQVTVVRKAKDLDGRDALLLWQEPVGRLERSFDFADPAQQGQPDRRIATAASLVDTVAARATLRQRDQMVRSVVSYVEAGGAARAAYQLGAFLAPLVAMPAIRKVAEQPVALLPEGPTRDERRDERHVVLLEIEDLFRSTLVDWRWETPNVYQFTAQLAGAVAEKLARGTSLKGWRTPAEVLRPMAPALLTSQTGTLRGCRLHRRRG